MQETWRQRWVMQPPLPCPDPWHPRAQHDERCRSQQCRPCMPGAAAALGSGEGTGGL